MKALLIGILIPAATTVACVALVGVWLFGGAPVEVAQRVPGTDRPPGMDTSGQAGPKGKPQLNKGDGVPAEVPGAWPRFRGRNLDGVSDDYIPLAKSWPPEGPPRLWEIEVGEGYAAAAIWEGRVYVLDYDRRKKTDVLRCLSLTDAKDIWRYSYPVDVKRNHGMSRTIPTVTDQVVVALGPKCHVTCLEPKTGEFRWAIDLVKDFGTRVPPWYAGQCPLVEGDRVILAPAGPDVLMMAVDAAKGDVVWQTPNPRGWHMTHSSVIPMEVAGVRMYVYCASGGVVGVAADNGAILWETTDWKISIATVPSPVIVGDGKIFLSGGYNAGSMMLQLKEEGGRFVAKPLFRLEPKVFGAAQQTPILYNGCLYGVRPNGELVCLDLNGKVVWASGPEHRFGLGPFLIAGGLLYVMDDTGLLTMVEATPQGYKPLDQAQVLSGHDAWGPMAILDGRLILRDLTRMVCLNVAAPK